MEDDDFEWDDAKAAQNLRRHGVSFAQAAVAIVDPLGVTWPERTADYGVDRLATVGLYRAVLLLVIWTERGDKVRIISARRADKHEQNRYYRQNSS
jgi:uncharacterized DUF497 family protein